MQFIVEPPPTCRVLLWLMDGGGIKLDDFPWKRDKNVST